MLIFCGKIFAVYERHWPIFFHCSNIFFGFGIKSMFIKQLRKCCPLFVFSGRIYVRTYVRYCFLPYMISRVHQRICLALGFSFSGSFNIMDSIFFFFFFFFWLRWIFVAPRGLSLVAASGGLLFTVVRGLLIAVASLVAEHEL